MIRRIFPFSGVPDRLDIVQSALSDAIRAQLAHGAGGAAGDVERIITEAAAEAVGAALQPMLDTMKAQSIVMGAVVGLLIESNAVSAADLSQRIEQAAAGSSIELQAMLAMVQSKFHSPV